MKSSLTICLVLLVLSSPFVNVKAYETSNAMQFGPLAPDVIVLEPGTPFSTVATPTLPLRVLVLSRAILLTSVTITLNRKVFTKVRLERDVEEKRRKFESRYELSLQEGENVIEVTASNEKASSKPEIRTVTYTPSASTKPDLLVLSIGISKYQASPSIQNASKDAATFVKLLGSSQANAEGLYANVKSQVLIDEGANRGALTRGLVTLNSGVRSHADVRVVFLSGAFLADYRSDSTYFLSFDYDGKTDPEVSSLNLRLIFARLAAVPGPILVFIDGNGFSSAGMRGAFNVIDQYSSQGNFFIYFCCDSKELPATPSPFDSSFMAALLEALTGKATENDRVIDTVELESYLKSRVRSLSSETQHPVFLGNQKPFIVFTPARTQP